MYEFLTAEYDRKDLDVFGIWASFIMFLAATLREEMEIGVIVCIYVCECVGKVEKNHHPFQQRPATLPSPKQAATTGYLYKTKQPDHPPVASYDDSGP